MKLEMQIKESSERLTQGIKSGGGIIIIICKCNLLLLFVSARVAKVRATLSPPDQIYISDWATEDSEMKLRFSILLFKVRRKLQGTGDNYYRWMLNN